MEAKLVVIDGDTEARQYDLELPTIIGRSRRTDLTLGNPLVSRQHCEVFEANGILMVRDLGSLNGTFVGETRIAEQAMPVKPGDLLSVGPVTFRAIYRTDKLPGAKEVPWEPQRPTLDAPLFGTGDDVKDTPGRPQRFPKGDDDDDETLPRRK
ncbi:MAG: FHA domain-containing protein [Planctomycetia bacterium]|nr:FHA domain-containing protein [Planctomycetia bacterium]